MEYTNRIPNENLILISNIAIEMGINRHFNQSERKALGKSCSYPFLLETPIDHYRNLQNLTKTEIGYSFKLAFFQRIHLNIEDVFHSPVNYHHYPIEKLENFTRLIYLFEENFDSFDKINSRLPKFRYNFKKRLLNYAFKFWLCGYGILQGYASKTISNQEIDFLMTKDKKLARFLASILMNNQLSPITYIPDTLEKMSVLASEQSKWEYFLNEYPFEISTELSKFTFEVLYGKAMGGYLLKYVNRDGIKIRKSLSSIRWGTFRAYSSSLRKFAVLITHHYKTIREVIPEGILEILSSKDFYLLPTTDQSNIKTVLTIWLECYSNINGLELNLNRIIPINVSNNERIYSKSLNFGTVHTFISTLLDDHNNSIDENKLFDLRARRAALIQLATGKRIHEVLLLKKDCLVRDAENNLFIHFHKTKNGVPQFLPATKDVIKWVEELKVMAPENKLHFSSEENTYGDDETDYRLLANIYNDGPLSVSAINRFLKRIQERLWSNIDTTKYYTSHDLRRMNAVYMKINGRSELEIQEQLGQLDINSQLTYLETTTPEIQKYFKEISEEGIWSHLNDGDKNMNASDNFPIEQLIKRSHKQVLSTEGKEKTKDFLESIFLKVAETKKKLPINVGHPIVSTGFPIRTHNCLASEIVSCGHTELHCFSCRSYAPDKEKLDEHKAEILRYILLLYHNDHLARQNNLEREVISLRSKDIKELLNSTFKSLFKKYNVSSLECKKVEKELYSKAKNYYKKYKGSKPTLSYLEALTFIKTGVIDGK